MKAGRLSSRMVEKVWGRESLPQPFAAPEGQRIGEVWFEAPPPLDALLAKYLFTSEKLSVQVHPDDARAPAGSRGKEECWLVLDAQDGAQLGIGFDRALSEAELRAGAQDGSIEKMLTWHDVRSGDFFYLPAGTVHAIGGGLSLFELQQNSDVTYRLYDYGRPRELHLDDAIKVADRGPYSLSLKQHVAEDENARLVDGPHFMLDHVVGAVPDAVRTRYRGAVLVMPLRGEIEIAGDRLPAGSCGWTNDLGDVRSQGARMLLFAPCR